MTPQRFAAWLSARSPRARAGIAFLAGLLAVLALPPFHALPVLALAFPMLLWLLDGALADAAGAARPGTRPSRRGAFVLGWCFGFGYFVAGLYWIANALLVDAARFGWLAPFAVAGLAAYFALYPALAVWVASFARPGPARIAALAASWTLAEMLRGIVLTGFPWNPLGSALALHPALIQGAALGGVFALSFVVALIVAAPATLAGANSGDGSSRARFAPVVAAVLVLGLLFVAGAVRLGGASVAAAESAPRLRIVQGAIPQQIKWDPALVRQHFGLYLRLSKGTPGAFAGQAPVAVIWPETAVPAVFDGAPEFARAVAQAAPPGGIVVTGVVRREAAAAPGRVAAVWNSIISVDGQGQVLARYDKHHLVPFGEYVPLARFNPLPKLTEGRVDFSAGPGPATLSLPGLPPLSPLICYEAIFPAEVTAATGPRPGLLLNLTNDAWFGAATGPYQHLVAARLRAVEEGLPLIRAANTGISAVIDAHGQIRQSLALGRRGVIDAVLPPATAQATVFARTGNMPIAAFMALLLAVILGIPRFRAGA